MNLQALTSYSKAVADQQRLLILRILARESFGVLELCRILDTNQPALSHHLKVLSNENLVETRRQGNSIFYRRALVHEEDALKELRSDLYSTIDRIDLSAEIECRISKTHADRRDQARSFFEKNARKLREQQRLIADYEHYSDCVIDLLPGNSGKGKAIEVGPGESDLLLDLHDRFEQVAVVDNAPEMLETTRRKLSQAGISDVDLFEGELKDYPGDADMIVLNMVLHHLASPAKFFREACDHLRPDGQLMIVDLTSHEQDWTRDACGDLWLGFDPSELDRWADDANLKQGQSAYLGLKNGFQVQVRTFQKSNQRKQ